MKSIRVVISTLLGAALVFSSVAVLFLGSPPQPVEAQRSITISATVPTALDLTVSTNTVNFGSINPGQFVEKGDAFALTVRTNTPTWNITTWTENANLVSESSTIPVQDNLLYSWQSGTWYPLSNISSSLFGSAEFQTPPTGLPMSMKLKVPVNTSPGNYSVTLLLHIQ